MNVVKSKLLRITKIFCAAKSLHSLRQLMMWQCTHLGVHTKLNTCP